MFTPVGQPRKLPFPLKDQVSNNNEVSVEGLIPHLFVWPEDSAERTVLPLFISLNEWIAIASSVDVGSDIAYPEQYVEVQWILYRNLAYAMPICSLIIDCIENNATTRAALAAWLASDAAAAAAIQQMIDSGTVLTGTGTSITNTNDAALFGAVTYMVDTINEAIQDLFQTFEASTNGRERGELVFSAIPVLETLPIDEISEYVTMLEENVVEAYLSQWDTTPITGSRDRIRCALFCAAKENGDTLTWSMIEDYFWGRVGFTMTNAANVIAEFIGFMLSGEWTGEEVVDISFGNFAAAMRNSSKFGDLVFPKLATLMALGQNDPDEDWEILCNDCVPIPPSDCTNFLATAGSWFAANFFGTPSTDWGSWISGQGLAPHPTFLNFYFWRPSEGSTLLVQSVTFTFNNPVSLFVFQRSGGAGETCTYSGAPTTTITFNETTNPAQFPVDLAVDRVINFGGDDAPNSAIRVTSFCYVPV